MADEVSREPARDPQDLERLLVSRQRAGDADGMAALYEPHAVLYCGGGRLLRGSEPIRAFYAGLLATGRKFEARLMVDKVVRNQVQPAVQQFQERSEAGQYALFDPLPPEADARRSPSASSPYPRWSSVPQRKPHI